MNLNNFLILLLIFLCEKVFADNQIFLEDRPASYCSIYTSTAVKILSERLKGIGKDDVIINNQSLGMGKKYNEDLVFLVKKYIQIIMIFHLLVKLIVMFHLKRNTQILLF